MRPTPCGCTSARLGNSEFAAGFRENDVHCAVRCGHRPLQHAVQNRNRPSIPEMSRNGIDAVCPQMRVVHSLQPKAIGKEKICARRGRSGRGAAKIRARQRAI